MGDVVVGDAVGITVALGAILHLVGLYLVTLLVKHHHTLSHGGKPQTVLVVHLNVEDADVGCLREVKLVLLQGVGVNPSATFIIRTYPDTAF